MSQERMDQRTRLPLGTRDAGHIPFVVGRYKESFHQVPEEERKAYWEQYYAEREKFKPGCFVKFIDDKFIYFEVCEKAKAHGYVNPALDEISTYDNVLVFMLPGITEPVRHHFEIRPEKRDLERRLLEAELEQHKEEDPGCAECWTILNNEVVRM